MRKRGRRKAAPEVGGRALLGQSALAELMRSPARRDGEFVAVCRRLVEVAAEHLEVELVSLWLLDLDHSAIRCVDLFQRTAGTHRVGGVVETAGFPDYFRALPDSELWIAGGPAAEPGSHDLSEAYGCSEGGTAILDVPLCCRGELCGVLRHEQVGPPRAWTPADRAFSLTAGGCVELLVAERGWREAERGEQRQNELLEALGATSVGLLNRHDLGSLLEATLSRACALMAVPHGYLYVVDRESEELVLRAELGLGCNRVGTRARRGQGLAGKVWETGAPLVMSDYWSWPERFRELDDLRIRAIAGVPLQAAGETVGVLGLASASIGRVFSDQEVATVRRFAQLAALVLENARVLEAANNELEERARAERALIDSENLLRLTFDGSPRGLGILSFDERFLQVNQALCELTGHSREELARLGLHDLCDPAAAPPADEAELLAGVLAGKTPRFEGDRRCRTKRGETFWGRLTASVVADHAGRPQHVLVELEDASERLRAEAAIRSLNEELERRVVERTADLEAAISSLRASESRMRGLLDALRKASQEWQSSFDAVDSVMALLDREGIVRRVNRAARDLLGIDYREINGRSLDDLARGEPWKTARLIVRQVQVSGSQQSAQGEDASGDRTWDVSASPVEGSRGGIVLLAREVSGIVALQRSLRRSQTLSAMGALVAGVAHEVRNPLFGISATLDALGEELGADTRFEEYRPRLQRELDRLNRLMNELLDYGRPTSLDRQPGLFGDVLAEALNACRPQAEAASVTIDAHLADSPLPLRMDLGRLALALENLILNAINHSPAGGRIRIEADGYLLRGQRWVQCSVEDQGPGFKPHDLPRVFEPFFTRRRGGTGLGLSIVQRIVEEHGGSVWAGNLPQGGAITSFTVPGSDPQAAG